MITLGGCSSSHVASMGQYPVTRCENLGPEVNSDADEFAPAFRGVRMLFTSNRPTIEGYIQGDDFWFSDREGAGWSQALNWGAGFNSTRDEGGAWFFENGKRVIFVQSWTPEGQGDADLYEAEMDSYGKMVRIRNLADVNSPYWDSQPFVNRAGTELYFCSDRPGGEGHSDIYVSKRGASGRWGKPVSLGPGINTRSNEKSPSLTPNDSLLFFASDGWGGLGGYDLFLVKRGKKGWGKVINLGTPFSSVRDDLFLRIAPREDSVFFASNRGGGEGGLDLWECWPNPFKDTTVMKVTLIVTVLDSVTQNPIRDARVTITGGEDRFTGISSARGAVSCRADRNEEYEIQVQAGEYRSKREVVQIPKSLSTREYRRTVYLGKPPTRGDSTTTPIAPVEDHPRAILYFDFDEATLRPDASVALQEYFARYLAPLLPTMDGMELMLDAHTDEKGTEDYNIQLSRRRGEVVLAKLRALGVPVQVMTMTPHGESQPATREDGESAARMNRRVEIVLVPTRSK